MNSKTEAVLTGYTQWMLPGEAYGIILGTPLNPLPFPLKSNNHDDATREYAHGPGGGLPDTHVGTFSDELMAKAKSNGWIVICMKDDWKRIFPFNK